MSSTVLQRTSVRRVRLREWQRRGPDDRGHLLTGIALDDPAARSLARRLTEQRVLAIRELRSGLEIESFAYVGRIQLGSLVVTVEPKLDSRELLALLRYAYGLRNLRLLDTAELADTGRALQDLIIQQLHAETRELIDRGLARRYVETFETLASPRGRIDLNRLAASSAPLVELPCRHHPRSSEHLLNHLLISGVHLGIALCADRGLKGSLHRLARVLEDVARPLALHASLFDKARHQLNRLTATYEPALKLIELLHCCSALSLDDGAGVTVSGFLFDMNRFYQTLLERFLRDHLDEHDVEAEASLHDMLRYVPGMNPRGRSSPRPRPDFVIHRRGQVQALLDAKYRDLWEHELPRDMLYQLSVYALSQPEGATAAIVYPTTAAEAREAIIEIRDPVAGRARAFVALRPLLLSRLARALEDTTGRQARELAAEVAFGNARGM